RSEPGPAAHDGARRTRRFAARARGRRARRAGRRRRRGGPGRWTARRWRRRRRWRWRPRQTWRSVGARMAKHHHLRENPVVRTALTRPITMLMIFASVLVLGVIAVINIPLELIPAGASAPYLSVEVPYGNATAQDVEDKTTRPLEAELATTPRLDQISATSSSSRARVNMMFEQDAD